MAKPHSDLSFTSDVAKFYEDALVPMIFEPYAASIATRARGLAPSSVLEVACGTGVVTRALAAQLPPSCVITATDLNDAMLAHGEFLGCARPVTWQQADVMALPFPDASCDVVVCQFGVMFFPDRVAAYREVRRVLRPGGTFLFNVWRCVADNEFAAVVTDAVGALFPDDPPLFLARTPHGHGSRDEIEADIRAAGFEHAALEQRDEVSSAASPERAAIAYCQGTPLRGEIEARAPGGLERATSVASHALRARFGAGPIEGRISAVVVAAS
ncbi:MAG: methyltransferase domain-containing protein [Planctomycetota bacterium]|nr:methyltransferase domain-containing protein [Planctomycetota bacterium]